MNDETFKKLLLLVSPYIREQDINMRKAIPAQERLAVTLRSWLWRYLSVLFLIAPNTISLFVPSVCDAIYKALKGSYLKV